MSQLFLIAIRNLIQHRKRSLMLGGAIAGVTMLLIFLTSLSSGVRKAMFEAATTIQTGHINVAGFYKVTAGRSAPIVTDYKKVMEVIKKSLPDVEYIVPRGRGWARVVSDTSSLQAGLAGIDINQEPYFKNVLHLESGDFNALSEPHTVLIFEAQAKRLNVKVGDVIVISALMPNGTNNTIDLRVVAIAQDVGIFSNFSVFMPHQSVNDLYQINSNNMGALYVYIKNIKQLPKDMDILRKSLTEAGYTMMDSDPRVFWIKFDSVNREDWTGQKIDLTTWEDEISFIKWTITAIDGITYILTSILLIIIVIGIMNSMWIAINERTREIGTLRAIGMQRRRVMSMFVIEAFTLSALATLTGAVWGLLLAGIVHALHIHIPTGAQMFLMSNTLKFSFDFFRVINGMFVIIGATTLISLIPSLRAARLKPITAMQHNG
ncbi:MAG: FtsX-like permease family protein [Spirochaetia bacterium]|nr:FtsX-like permease family protein [Spirochaetia bacterium]